MPLYTESLIWYLFLLDCLAYNILAWLPKKKKQRTHWLSDYFPINRFLGVFYFFFILWTGFLLYRMQLLGFYR